MRIKQGISGIPIVHFRCQRVLEYAASLSIELLFLPPYSTSIKYKNELKLLLTLNFQTFEKVKIVTMGVYMGDFEMFEQLLSCRTIDELYASTARIIKQMGFDHFLYTVRVHTSLTRPYQFILSGYPKEWYNHYFEAGYLNNPSCDLYCETRDSIG